MAIPKVCGIETEYGIAQPGVADSNPITSSSVLINAYIAEVNRRVAWDFEDESPGNDARGFSIENARPPEIETHLVNAVLTNGARYYVDHAHPEYSSPECSNALEATLYDKAGEEVLKASMAAVARHVPTSAPIVVYKNNSDGKGNSYGCHENYLLDRELAFSRIVNHMVPFFVTRQIMCGAGKIGTEFNGMDDRVPFQLSQRSDFFEEIVGLETTLKRPIINTRDEPHGDARKYRRLHVIVGDANMSEISTFLKLGSTSLVLAMIEDDFLSSLDLTIASPISEIHKVSWDTQLEHKLELKDGRHMSALEIQWAYLERARRYAAERGLEAIGGTEIGNQILETWERILTGLESNPKSLANELDWVAKLKLFESYMERHDIDWDSARLAAMDIQFHDLRPEKSLFSRLGIKSLFDHDAVLAAVSTPPRGTRAYFRGRCLEKWGSSVAAANWDSLVFDLGTDPLRRVPMMDPLRGTADMVDVLIEECETPAELLKQLGA
jgi:Pup amidohydrolase